MTCVNATPLISQCTISGNVAPQFGGAMHAVRSAPRLENCVICGNVPNNGYGADATAIYAADSDLTIANCTIADNVNPFRTYGYGSAVLCNNSNVVVTNSILWNQVDKQIRVTDGVVTLIYNDVKGGSDAIDASWGGSGNISVDP